MLSLIRNSLVILAVGDKITGVQYFQVSGFALTGALFSELIITEVVHSFSKLMHDSDKYIFFFTRLAFQLDYIRVKGTIDGDF